MNDQQLIEFLLRGEETRTLIQREIEQFNNGNLENALSVFEEAFEVNPKSIPNLLYYSLCCFSLIQKEDFSNLEKIAHPEVQKHIRDIISKLEIAIENLTLIKL